MGAKQTETGPTVGDGFVHVSYESKKLGGQVLVVLDVDDATQDYQWGVSCGDIALYEIWAGGVNWGPHITQSFANVLAHEAAEEYEKKAAIQREEMAVWRAAA